MATEENKPITSKKRKHYWWRYLLVFFAGVLSSGILVGGGVAIASTQIKTTNVEQWTNMEGKLFTDKYQNTTLWDILMKSINGEIHYTSLEGLNDFTPLLNDFLKGVLDTLGISEDDYKKIASYEFADYGKEEFVETLTKAIKIPKIITAERVGNPYIADALGHYTKTDDTVGDFTVYNLMNNTIYQTDIKNGEGYTEYLKYVLDHVYLVDILSINRDFIEEDIRDDNQGITPTHGTSGIQRVLCYMAYTLEEATAEGDPTLVGKCNPNKPRSVKGIQGDGMNDIVQNLRIRDVVTISPDNKILMAIADTKICDLDAKIKTLTFKDVIDTSSSKILEALKDAKLDGDSIIGALKNVSISAVIQDTNDVSKYSRWYKPGDPVEYSNEDTCPAGFVANPDCNKLLSLFVKKDTSISNFSTLLDEIKLGDIIDGCDDPNSMLYDLRNKSITTLSEADFKGIKITSAFGSDIYGGDPAAPENIKGIWKYLLHDSTDPYPFEPGHSVSDYKYSTYTINDIGTLMSNITANMQSAKLRDLYADGVIGTSDPTMFDKKLPLDTKMIGDYTLTELMNKLSTMVS